MYVCLYVCMYMVFFLLPSLLPSPYYIAITGAMIILKTIIFNNNCVQVFEINFQDKNKIKKKLFISLKRKMITMFLFLFSKLIQIKKKKTK